LVVEKAKERRVRIEALGKYLKDMTEEELEEGNVVTKEMVESAIRRLDPIFYCHFGHGDVDRLKGSKPDEYLIHADVNVDLLKGRTVYAFACLSAQKLGARAVEIQCLAYCGYVDVVCLVLYCVEIEEGVVACEVAEGNEETATKFPLEMIDGKTTGEAYKNALEEYDHWIQYWYGVDPNCYAQFSWNKQQLVLLGSEKEIIYSPIDVLVSAFTPLIIPILILTVLIRLLRAVRRAS